MATRTNGDRWENLRVKLAAEALATYAITATATGIDVLYYDGHGVDFVSRWLARGMVAAAAIYAFSEISGAHANPAVTLGFLLRRACSLKTAAGYVAAQFAGAVAAAATLWALYRSHLALGASHPSPPFTPVEAAICEGVLTCALLVVVLLTATENAVVGKQAALAVGFTIAACGMAGGPISGASMNPARTLAPQLLAGAFGSMWIYLAGPFAGAALAALIHWAFVGTSPGIARAAVRGK